ncbi:MAG: hypothetical protein AB1454_14120 [Candidatus Auribacterota bacterium]
MITMFRLLMISVLTLGCAAALYAIVYKRLSIKQYSLLNVLRLAFLIILLWLVTEPMITRKIISKHTKPVSFIIDTSQSMRITDQGIPAQSRISAVVSAMTGNDSVLDYLKRKDIPYTLFSAGEQLRIQPAMPEHADDRASRLIACLNAVPANTGTVFYISDGRSTDTESTLSESAANPVITIGMGNPSAAPDIWIESVTVPSFVEIDTPAELRIYPGQHNIPDSTPVSIRITADKDTVIADTTVPFSEAANTEFQYTAGSAGLHTLSISVSAPGIPESFTENNSKTVGIMARKNTIRITMLASPSWDSAALARSLKSIQNADITLYNYIAPKTDAPFYSISEKAHYNSSAFVRTIEKQDVLIFCDVPLSRFAENDINKIVAFLSDGGGILIFGGRQSLGAGNYMNSPINSLLPVYLSVSDFYQNDYRITVPEGTVSHPLAAPVSQAITASGLPPLTGMNISYSVRTGAEVYLETSSAKGDTFPLFSVQPTGSGKCAVFSGKGIYRWAMETEASATNTLTAWLKNVIGWIASPGESAYLHITIPRINYNLGEKISIEAEVLDRTFEPAPNAVVEGIATSDQGQRYPVDFVPVSGKQAAWQASFLPPEQGTYKIEVSAVRSPDDISTVSTEMMVHAKTDEFKNLAADWNFLRSLADQTGGEFIPFSEFKDKAQSLKPETVRQVQTISKMVMDYPLILIILIALITTEWVIRIKEGLN